ncbi:MAG: hypothetical protein JST70_12580 [Bacteroidetes bacterium]|nr:hypothetical protein [Bacteroidota bacterium]
MKPKKETPNKLNTIISVLVLSALIGMIIYSLFEREQLANNNCLTTGIVTQCKFLPRSGGRIGVRYHYTVNSKVFNGSSTRIGLNQNDCDSLIIGKNFPVLYNPDNNCLSALLLTPGDFKTYTYKFPDSLKWILKYIKE